MKIIGRLTEDDLNITSNTEIDIYFKFFTSNRTIEYSIFAEIYIT